jgi:hypothetical protein
MKYIGMMIGGSVVAIVVAFALVCLFWYMGISNTEQGLRIKYEAQTKVVETTMDNMKKTLINQFKVNSQFAETFIKCMATQAEGRKGGGLFKMVTEASGGAPQTFTPDVSLRMMASIDGKLAEFKRAQDVWIDVWREHKTFCSLMPQSWFLKSRVFPEPNVISSESSKESMKSGKMDDEILK